MGAKEAEAIVGEVTLKVYRMSLRRALAEGAIAAASSPAAFLQGLCDRLQFPPPSAEAVNVELFRARLEELVKADGDKLSDAAEAELQALAAQLGLRISMLSHGKCLLFADFLPPAKRAERLAMPLPQLVETVSKAPLPPGCRHLVFSLSASDEADDDVEVPDVRCLI